MEFQNQEKCIFGGKKCVVGQFECKYSENKPMCAVAGKVLWQQNG